MRKEERRKTRILLISANKREKGSGRGSEIRKIYIFHYLYAPFEVMGKGGAQLTLRIRSKFQENSTREVRERPFNSIGKIWGSILP